MATFNLQFPDMSGMNSTDIKRELQKIKDYVYMLNEQLRYHFSNIDETNIVDGSIGESALSIPVKTQIQDTAGNVSKLQQTAKSISADIESIEGDLAQIVLEADSLLTRVENNEGDISSIQQAATALTSRVSNAEGNISTLTQTASSLTSRVSSNEGDISTLQQTTTSLQSQITNNDGDISTLQQTTSNISASVQTIQGGITNKSMVEIADDRASIATSSGVQTSHISVLGNQIDIATGGKLNATGAEVNIKAGSKLDVSSGGDFNLEAGSGATAMGLSNIRADNWFLWTYAGNSFIDFPWIVIPRHYTEPIRLGGLTIRDASGADGWWCTLNTPNVEQSLALASDSKILLARVYLQNGQTVYGANYLQIGDGSGNAVQPNYIGGSLQVNGNVRATGIFDSTPAYKGDALRDIKMIASDSDGNIDHSTLPKCARAVMHAKKNKVREMKFVSPDNPLDDEIKEYRTTKAMAASIKGTGNIDGVQTVQEVYDEDDYELVEGRDISVMISMFTVAIQQLTDLVEKQQAQIDSLIKQQASKQPIAKK